MSVLDAPGLSVDDQAVLVEVGELLEFVADLLARAEGPLLRSDFARFTSGLLQPRRVAACLHRFARRLGAEGWR